MKLSTRNRLPGTVTEVVKGEAAAKVTLQVGDNHMVALITRESADELGLEPGMQVTAGVPIRAVGARGAARSSSSSSMEMSFETWKSSLRDAVPGQRIARGIGHQITQPSRLAGISVVRLVRVEGNTLLLRT
jgi:molybdopterin-binding protein